VYCHQNLHLHALLLQFQNTQQKQDGTVSHLACKCQSLGHNTIINCKKGEYVIRSGSIVMRGRFKCRRLDTTPVEYATRSRAADAGCIPRLEKMRLCTPLITIKRIIVRDNCYLTYLYVIYSHALSAWSAVFWI
jgi:hypothetical protein